MYCSLIRKREALIDYNLFIYSLFIYSSINQFISLSLDQLINSSSLLLCIHPSIHPSFCFRDSPPHSSPLKKSHPYKCIHIHNLTYSTIPFLVHLVHPRPFQEYLDYITVPQNPPIDVEILGWLPPLSSVVFPTPILVSQPYLFVTCMLKAYL